MKVTAHPLAEVYIGKLSKANDLRSITHSKDHSNDWISTTTTLYNPNDGLVYLGLTQMDGDIFYSFDPETHVAKCLNYLSVRVAEEVKIHRSLAVGPDGRLYSGSAGLISIPTRNDAPGGQIWAYDPKTGEYEVFGIPAPHDYVQHVVFDFERQMAYGCTYPVPFFFAFDMKARETKLLTFIGCYPHRSAVAPNGTVWTGYSMSADAGSGDNMLMSYDPDTNKATFHKHSLPQVGQQDMKQIDDAETLSDGLIYFGTVDGGFSRLDPETGEVEWLGKPARGMRLCGIVEGTDGLIYIATGAYYAMKGDDAHTHIFSYDRKTKHFEDLGRIYDPVFGDGCVVVHSLTQSDDGTLWVGETDNNYRSGCLWECRLG